MMVLSGCGTAAQIFLYLAILARYFGGLTLGEITDQYKEVQNELRKVSYLRG